jgi:transcriptional regulator with XRE-family HTH domain
VWYREVRVAVDIGTEGTIGGRIRAAREAALLPLDTVAERAGLAPERLAGIESGDPLATIELDAVAAALGVGVHGLLHSSDVRDVLGRVGEASPERVDAAVGLLTQFVRDYEFLCSLDD